MWSLLLSLGHFALILDGRANPSPVFPSCWKQMSIVNLPFNAILYGYIINYLSILLLIDLWIISNFELL